LLLNNIRTKIKQKMLSSIAKSMLVSSRIGKMSLSSCTSKSLKRSLILCSRSYSAASLSKYKHLLTDVKGQNKNIGLIQLNRPKALNALCAELMDELSDAVKKFDSDPSIGCMILTGSTRAFAAGADIKEMQNKKFSEVCNGNFLGNWTALADAKTPVIAAVNGFALGGGNLLALLLLQ
jgi:enoyl-CoA hydratase